MILHRINRISHLWRMITFSKFVQKGKTFVIHKCSTCKFLCGDILCKQNTAVHKCYQQLTLSHYWPWKGKDQHFDLSHHLAKYCYSFTVKIFFSDYLLSNGGVLCRKRAFQRPLTSWTLKDSSGIDKTRQDKRELV